MAAAVDFPQRKGGTHIYAGVKLANREMGYAFSVTRTGRGIKRIYFIVTDGAGTDSVQLLKESNLAKKAGVEIFTIAVGQDANKPENVKLLKRVAGTELCEVSNDLAKLDACPGDNENFIGVQDYSKLAARVQKFVGEICLEITSLSCKKGCAQDTREIIVRGRGFGNSSDVYPGRVCRLKSRTQKEVYYTDIEATYVSNTELKCFLPSAQTEHPIFSDFLTEDEDGKEIEGGPTGSVEVQVSMDGKFFIEGVLGSFTSMGHALVFLTVSQKARWYSSIIGAFWPLLLLPTLGNSHQGACCRDTADNAVRRGKG